VVVAVTVVSVIRDDFTTVVVVVMIDVVSVVSDMEMQHTSRSPALQRAGMMHLMFSGLVRKMYPAGHRKVWHVAGGSVVAAASDMQQVASSSALQAAAILHKIFSGEALLSS
jgi:hypothetical protein